ncbi:unnamed protein product, partial [Mesorhabditis spiculigera]
MEPQPDVQPHLYTAVSMPSLQATGIAPSPGSRMTLTTPDGTQHYIARSDVEFLSTVSNIIQDLDLVNSECPTVPIPVRLNAEALSNVILFGRQLRDGCWTTVDWLHKFVGLPPAELFVLADTANYLGAAQLLDKIVLRMSSELRGKTPAKMREYLGVEDDISPEAREQIEKEFAKLRCQ